jgi:hypothetical protein
MSLNLSEITRDLVQTQIKNTIAQSLAEVRSLRDDPSVSTEPPKSYFIYAPAAGYRAPAIFTIVDRMSFKQFDDGANSIVANVFINVVALVEDRDLNHLTIKADRYMTALHQSLNEITIVDPNNLVRIWIKVIDGVFSEIYAPKRDTPEGTFRKEVHLTCNVLHYEGL